MHFPWHGQIGSILLHCTRQSLAGLAAGWPDLAMRGLVDMGSGAQTGTAADATKQKGGGGAAMGPPAVAARRLPPRAPHPRPSPSPLIDVYVPTEQQ